MKMTRKHPLAECESCPLQKEKYCGSVGPNTAEIVIVGEAPGSREVRKGQPFTGISGQLLDTVLREHQLRRKRVFLTNTVLCRPRGNADPPEEALRCCAPRLREEINSRSPDYIIPLGNTAARAILGRKVKITKERVGPPRDSDLYPGVKVVPSIHPAACLRSPDWFPFLVTDIGKIRNAAKVKWEPPRYKVADNPTQAAIALAQLAQRNGPIAVDLEVGYDKDEVFNHPKGLLCAGIAYEPGRVLVLGKNAVRSNQVRRSLGDYLRRKEVTYHNGKYDTGVLYALGLGQFQTAYDTMLASYTLDERPGTHGLEYLGTELLGTPRWKSTFPGFEKGTEEELYLYNAYDAATTLDLQDLQAPLIKEEGLEGLNDLLVRASNMLMVVEQQGIKVDRKAAEKAEAIFIASIDKSKRELNELLEVEGFNPNSPTQVKEILERVFSIKTKSTDEEHLAAMNDGTKLFQAFRDRLLTHRELVKMKGTYVTGIIKRLDPNDYTHTTFKIHGTVTGRLSSANPNLQNQPRIGKIRDMYIPEEGNKFVYLDYKNIEGRVVAVLSNAHSAIAMFQKGVDIHNVTSERFFGSDYDKEQRVTSKKITHGLNYARTAHGISTDPDVTLPLKQIQEFVEFYKEMLPEIFEWHEQVKEVVFNSDDHLQTPFGRKRRYTLIVNENIEDITKEAIAFQPQSIGSDITLEAAIRLHREGYAIRNLIHDGILVEVPQRGAEGEAERMAKIMEQTAAEVYTDKIPFPVDWTVGDNWGQL